MKQKQFIPFPVYNVLLCLLCAIIFVLGCLCVEAAEERWYLKWDLSDDGVTALSDYTLDRLSQLKEEITLYSVGTGGSLHDLQMETLMKMSAVCPLIKVETIVPDAQPQRLMALAGEAEGIGEGTVFVQNGQGTRTVRIDAEEFLFSRRLDGEDYTIYCGEAQLIGAIERVTDDDPAALWFVSGHGEMDEEEGSQLALQARAMGMEVRSGVLAMMEPVQGDVLLLIGPQSDLTQQETLALKAFLRSGVHMMVACGADTPINRLPNLMALCELYGLGYEAGWVVESSAETERFVDRPELLSPVLTDENGIVEKLNGRLILPRACALKEPELRPGVTAKLLLETSLKAVLRADKNGNAYTFSAADKSGRMPLAIWAQSSESCILQLSSVDMLRTGLEAAGSYVLDASENLSFWADCLACMINEGETATLDAGVKQLSAQLISFDSARTQQVVSLVLLLAMPLMLAVLMLAVVIRRRRL